MGVSTPLKLIQTRLNGENIFDSDVLQTSLSFKPSPCECLASPVQYNGFLVCYWLFFHFHSFFSYIVYNKKIDIPIFVTGILSGLVGITGKSRVVNPS